MMAREKMGIMIARLRLTELSTHSQEWLKALDGFLKVFSQAILSGEAFEQVVTHEILVCIEKALSSVTVVEDRKFRSRADSATGEIISERKNVWRCLLFILSTNVGRTVVPHGRGRLAILDDRYDGVEVIKGGEGVEGLQGLEEYVRLLMEFDGQLDVTSDDDESETEVKKGALTQEQSEQLDRVALQALAELADLFYNWAQLRMNLSGKEKARFSINHFVEGFDSDVDKRQVRSLIVYLYCLALWKFHFRYFELGFKDPEAEEEHLLKKMAEIGISPRGLLEDQWILVQELVARIIRVARSKMIKLARSENLDQELINLIKKYTINPNAIDRSINGE